MFYKIFVKNQAKINKGFTKTPHTVILINVKYEHRYKLM